MCTSKKPPSKATELHLAKRDIDRFDGNRKFAETVKVQAEMELSNARQAVEDLTQRIGESKAKTRTRRKELQGLRNRSNHEEHSIHSAWETTKIQCKEVMKELEIVKQELSQLKLDIATVKEAKAQAEKQTELSIAKARSFSNSAEAIKNEIEEINEEEVLVELARMEAIRELEAIEAQKQAEAARFSATMEETQKRMKDILQEIDQSKENEAMLEITASDAEVLQNELNFVKAMEQKSEKHKWDSPNFADRIDKKMEEELLESATKELDDAKRELASIREEGFKFMASMDVIRSELRHVTDESARLTKIEKKTDSKVKNLNFKLLRAKSKLDSATDAEEKARSIISNLSATVQQLQDEMEAAKKERELISNETASIKLEIQRTESNMELEEERLQAAMQELEAVKESEAKALENLRVVNDKTMHGRASSSQRGSTITISSFEYEYLTQRAKGAKEVADKKVAAAQAWIEAIKASEKEILMKTEMAQREIRELRLVEEQEVCKTEKALAAKRAVEGELREKQMKHEHLEAADQVRIPRKPMKDNGTPLTPKRAKMMRRPSSSPAVRYTPRSGSNMLPRSGSVTLRKKQKKIMPSLAKFFKRK
ncbi:hypothetical protein ACLOJK_001258 [Asimina triloba]